MAKTLDFWNGEALDDALVVFVNHITNRVLFVAQSSNGCIYAGQPRGVPSLTSVAR
jgi:hypothetical protein